jgi:Tol biopolymer transport system component
LSLASHLYKFTGQGKPVRLHDWIGAGPPNHYGLYAPSPAQFADVSWSPDGSHVAAIAWINAPVFGPHNQTTIVVADVATGRLVYLPEFTADYVAWSPRGDYLAFSIFDQGVFVVYPDGTGRRRVTGNPPSSMLYSYSGVSWSPDGSQIAFSREPDQGPLEVDIVGVDGSGLRRISDAAVFRTCWSPDGKTMALTDGWQFGASGVDLMSIADGVPHPLAYTVDALAWSPDGKELAVAHKGKVFILDTSGRQLTELTQISGLHITALAWWGPS